MEYDKFCACDGLAESYNVADGFLRIIYAALCFCRFQVGRELARHAVTMCREADPRESAILHLVK